MRIYVASSWRNEFQPSVVKALREDGHEVYDFKDEEGFHWTEVDEGWQRWVLHIPAYLKGLQHPAAERGFNRDMNALKSADICVYVMPCGVSASLEAGWAIGAGKPTVVYVPGLREPDLMVKMADLVTDDFEEMRVFVKAASEVLAERPTVRMIDGRALASACRKLLPPQQVTELLSYLDPLGTFVNSVASAPESVAAVDPVAMT